MSVTDSASRGQHALLDIAHLDAGYGEMQVLRGITMSVRPAEIVAMVGSNGAGKTTLLRAISRIIPSKGEVRFDGRPLGHASADDVFAMGLVQVPEGRQLFDRMSVEENLRMGAYRRRDAKEIAEDLDRMYAIFPRLADRRRQIAGSMSGGEQQMCAMARALMAKPRLMMVDEMSLGLAPVIVDLLLETMSKIRADGVTVLLVEQDVHAALSVADRGYVLETGEIVREGSARELESDPEVQRAYLGDITGEA
ncbi:MAG TPA: ABC transporter ATP-binding protein [Casimicrobiaceae bacterium]|nr:ABC transporter ATP-binding protein [Casimicrobiaceae bacterium]